MANLRARRAAGPFVGGKKPKGVDRESATADIRQSIDEIEHLLDVAATTERLSLLASTYKRLALATGSSRERAEAVSMMTSYYARAVELDPDDPYPLLNALGGIVLMGGPWKNPPRTLKDSGLATSAEFEFALERAQSLAEQKEASSKNFWDRIHVKDLALVRGLASGGLAQPEQVKRIARGYWGLWHLYGSPGALDSVKDQVGFLAMVIKGSRGQALSHLKEQVAGLESLQALLSKPPKMGD